MAFDRPRREAFQDTGMLPKIWYRCYESFEKDSYRKNSHEAEAERTTASGLEVTGGSDSDASRVSEPPHVLTRTYCK